MTNRLIIIVLVVFLAALSPTNGAARSPVVSGTVPSSGYRSGLIRTPNPIGTSSNLVVTGNIRGGRHFRGIVPYQSTTDFRAASPSSYLDSFLRRSADSENFGRFSGKAVPYYSPTRTVTFIKPGQTAIFRPQVTKYGIYGSRTAGSDTTGILLPRQYRRDETSWPNTTLTNVRTRPMSMTTEQLQKVLSSEINKYTYIVKPVLTDDIDEQRTKQIKQLQGDLKVIGEKTAQLKQSLIDQSQYARDLQPSAKDRLTDKLSALPQSKHLWKIQPVEEPTSKDKPSDAYKQIDAYDQTSLYGPTGDIYEQMKHQLDDSQKPFELWRPKTKRQPAQTDVLTDDEEEKPAQRRSRPAPASETVAEESFQTKNYSLDEIPDVDSSAEAKSILGPHKTFASPLADGFNKHIGAAENYLKEGKYYKAADAYTLASIYKPTDPLAYAGKSHALFAAGEYMSSALFLYKTLDMFPEYARFKIDIVAMVGDRDTLETRIADVEQWLKINDSPELHFLLGYVYYQIGRLNEAKKQADIACEKMPGVLAAIALKEAIDNAVK